MPGLNFMMLAAMAMVIFGAFITEGKLTTREAFIISGAAALYFITLAALISVN